MTYRDMIPLHLTSDFYNSILRHLWLVAIHLLILRIQTCYNLDMMNIFSKVLNFLAFLLNLLRYFLSQMPNISFDIAFHKNKLVCFLFPYSVVYQILIHKFYMK